MPAKVILYLILLLSSLFVSISSAQTPNDNFLVITDPHLDVLSAHKMNFSPSSSLVVNDLDKSTFQSLLQKTSEGIQQGVIAKPKFILFLGDIVGHLRIFPTEVVKSEMSVFQALHHYFPTTPILYVFGNNDSLSANYGPFQSKQKIESFSSPIDIAKIYNKESSGFLSTGIECKSNNHTFPCIITKNTKHGYYAVYIAPQFRLVVLNTILHAPRRSGIQEHDAKEQMVWLREQLKTAQNKQESTLLAMHIPPGRNLYDHTYYWNKAANTDFLKIIKTYHSTIIGLLAAHTHYEEIKIIQDESQHNLVGVYFTAALSTSHANAPSIKTFYYAKQKNSWELTNYDTFYFTKDKHAAITLKKLYDYKNYYCNGQNKNLFQCLPNVTSEKMSLYYRAGNNQRPTHFKWPEDMIIIAK